METIMSRINDGSTLAHDALADHESWMR